MPGELNHHIYKRYDDKYEVGYRDSEGKLRWPGPFTTIKEARSARVAKSMVEATTPRWG